MFCEGHVSLKETLKKCKQFHILHIFQKNLRKIQGDFQTCWTSSAFQRRRQFRVPKWSQG
jgi:hypothetical protein